MDPVAITVMDLAVKVLVDLPDLAMKELTSWSPELHERGSLSQ